jgi:hypothetical protein
MIHGKDCQPCCYCQAKEKAIARRKADKRIEFKAYLEQKRDAILSGKVIVLWQVDDYTGIHYRTNKHGQYVEGGCGNAR